MLWYAGNGSSSCALPRLWPGSAAFGCGAEGETPRRKRILAETCQAAPACVEHDETFLLLRLTIGVNLSPVRDHVAPHLRDTPPPRIVAAGFLLRAEDLAIEAAVPAHDAPPLALQHAGNVGLT